jgi:pimeloyl-ACP methyl ester carboxylesterase
MQRPSSPETTRVTVEGMDLHVALHGAGDPLLLLHGYGGAGSDFGHLFDLDELARRHRLIIPDLRGHGRTLNPAPTNSHRQCAIDVAALLDELGVARTAAIGLSMGGNTLLHLATREPKRISAMVVVSSTMYFPERARAIMRSTTVDSRSPAEWEEMRGRHAHGDEQIRSLWRELARWAVSHDDMTFTPPLLATIEARTLLVYGDRDPLYPVDMALDMHRAIPGAVLAVVPNGCHLPVFADHQRSHFVMTALAFLRQEGAFTVAS